MTEQNKQFIEDFVAAAKASDTAKMEELSRNAGSSSIKDRVDLLGQLITSLEKEEGVDKRIAEGLGEVKNRLITSSEYRDSTGEEDKEDSKSEEATQDVAADTSAEEAEGERTESAEDSAATETEAESGGYAPASEEEEEKTEGKA